MLVEVTRRYSRGSQYLLSLRRAPRLSSSHDAFRSSSFASASQSAIARTRAVSTASTTASAISGTSYSAAAFASSSSGVVVEVPDDVWDALRELGEWAPPKGQERLWVWWLLKALYGFDPLSGGTYSWENFHQEVGQSAKL